jgi:hypothetical protein
MKKTILSLAVVTALASGAFAMGMGGNCQNGAQAGMMQCKGSMQQGMHGRSGGHEMRMLGMLNLKANHMEKVFNLLTKEQRAELKTLMDKKLFMLMMGKKS